MTTTTQTTQYWHGTTVGWLDLNNPATNRTYGFQPGLHQFGETDSAQEFVWLTEYEQTARNQTTISLDAVKRRQTAGKNPFANHSMAAGRYVYQVEPSKFAVRIDLGAKLLTQNMLDTLASAVEDTVSELGLKSIFDTVGITTPANRQKKFANFDHGWLDWLGRELGLYDAKQNSLTSDDERFSRIMTLARHAGINWIANIQAHPHPVDGLYLSKDNGYRDWAVLPKVKRSGGNWVRTYKIVNKYLIP